MLAARLERSFEDEVLDEMRNDAVLALRGHDDQSLAAGVGSFRSNQLDAGGVDDRQQLLGHGLGGRQETRAQTSRRDHRGTRHRH